ncbi:aromatic amino acid transaminase [Novosphingobium aerophilum]|uniref:amino acid aminotransferase n=1 Tax=Novosphingobium TaxID=165696 RepID=UPI00104BA3C6|nr:MULTISPECIES: aromatic amino acid transaminase [unclassified Novosphingobium]MPS70888.1 aspartate/tyrosine/aromatic aminotransferase [Novosphingobium sp.]TCM33193.1 aromatic-amino-acid transaminase [Novosphingobium sp. ST904]WRT92697.1 aromatic amino acid transaminase [Novosphingobium sp. RL4]
MLTNLQQQPADALLALIKLHNDDPRADKIDLGVGVYRTGEGDTPVFRSIKAAEAKLVAEQDSKAYLGPEGDMGFVEALMPYVFGKADPSMGGRIEGMQTPGGTGSLRLALAMVKRAGYNRIIVGVPSWPNHAQICADLGLEVVEFNHALASGTTDMDALRGAIANAQAGDAILLHGCCHNPTGIDYSNEQWDEIAGLIAASKILPILDLAYQGLGKGMEEDAYGLRRVLAAVPEALICYSCDKNFGLYRDRVGALYAMVGDPADLTKVMSNGHNLARANWSQPPDHGGAAVRLVLEDETLTADWLAELDEMRDRMREVRAKLAEAGTAGSADLTPMGGQNGLFSIVPLNKDQVLAMRTKHGVYMAGSGRINVAGLTMGNIDKFIAAVADVTA